MTSSMPQVLVLGGGIIGTTSAWYLAQAGCRVTLIERQPGVGLETSFANGSLITPSMSDPWAAPGLPWQLLKWLGREDAPFLLRLRALPGLMAFGPAFLRNCTAARWRQNTGTILRLTRYSQRLLNELIAATGIAYDGASLGILRLCREPAALEHAAKVAGAVGVRYEMLDAAGCAAMEPAIAPAVDRIAGGIHFPDDQSGDAYKFTAALAGLARDAGVDFRFGTAIRGLETAGDRVTGVITDQGRLEADRYLVALGCAGSGLLRPLGLELPVYPVKGYSVTLELDGWNGAPRLPLVDSGRKLAIVRLGDRLRLAGTAELTGYDTTLNPARGANLLEKSWHPAARCPERRHRPPLDRPAPHDPGRHSDPGALALRQSFPEPRPWPPRLDHGLRLGQAARRSDHRPPARDRARRHDARPPRRRRSYRPDLGA